MIHAIIASASSLADTMRLHANVLHALDSERNLGGCFANPNSRRLQNFESPIFSDSHFWHASTISVSLRKHARRKSAG